MRMPDTISPDEVWINGNGHIGFLCPHIDPVGGEFGDVPCVHWNELEVFNGDEKLLYIHSDCNNCGKTVRIELPKKGHTVIYA